MQADAREVLIAALSDAIRPWSFSRVDLACGYPGLAFPAAWRRRTLNTNRAIVVVAVPTFVARAGPTSARDSPASVPTLDYAGSVTAHPGELAQRIKLAVGHSVGYLPVVYELGLQLVLTGFGLLNHADRLERFVDPVNNHRVILQSLHVIDFAAMKSASVRTWGQFVTGPVQDAIEYAIARALAGSAPRPAT